MRLSTRRKTGGPLVAAAVLIALQGLGVCWLS